MKLERCSIKLSIISLKGKAKILNFVFTSSDLHKMFSVTKVYKTFQVLSKRYSKTKYLDVAVIAPQFLKRVLFHSIFMIGILCTNVGMRANLRKSNYIRV